MWRFESGYRPEKNEIVRCTMKSERGSDEIFSLRLQMKLNPPPLTLRSKISSRSDFIHEVDLFRVRSDLTEKDSELYPILSLFLAGAEGLEPTTHGFGDQYSTN